MKIANIIAAALAVISFPSISEARWRVSSEFKLQIPESLLNTVVQRLNNNHSQTEFFSMKDTAFSFGETKAQLSGLNARISFSMAAPKRIPSLRREWGIESQNLSASVTVAQLFLQQRQISEVNGVILDHEIAVECRDLKLSLPERAQAKIQAKMLAVLEGGEVKFSVPNFSILWAAGAWQIDSLNCPQLRNIRGEIRDQIISILSASDHFHEQIDSELAKQLVLWSKKANLQLFAARGLIQQQKDLKVSIEPSAVVEKQGGGIIVSGYFHFDFLLVKENRDEQFRLPQEVQAPIGDRPNLLVPFSALRALALASFHAGRLNHSLPVSEISELDGLMSSRTKQFFAWPDLMLFPRRTSFFVRFRALAAPAILKEQAGTKGSIHVSLNMPLSAQVYAPIDKKWLPYVEFQTRAESIAELTLKKGIVKTVLNLEPSALAYRFDTGYVETNNPNTYIAAKKIGAAIFDAFNEQGFQFSLPTFPLGDSELLPERWSLLPERGKASVMKVELSVSSRRKK